jgi:hypothetical protein
MRSIFPVSSRPGDVPTSKSANLMLDEPPLMVRIRLAMLRDYRMPLRSTTRAARSTAAVVGIATEEAEAGDSAQAAQASIRIRRRLLEARLAVELVTVAEDVHPLRLEAAAAEAVMMRQAVPRVPLDIIGYGLEAFPLGRRAQRGKMRTELHLGSIGAIEIRRTDVSRDGV